MGQRIVCASSVFGRENAGILATAGTTAAAVLLAVGLGGCAPAEVPTGPHRVPAGQATFVDVGAVRYDSSRITAETLAVEIENQSDQPLDVTAIRSSCGCAQSRLEDGNTIAARSSNRLLIQLSSNFAGDQNFSLTLEHGEASPPTEISVRGSFYDLVQLDPVELVLDRAGGDLSSRSGYIHLKTVSHDRQPPSVQATIATDGMKGPDAAELQIGEPESRGSQHLAARYPAYLHSYRIPVTLPEPLLADEPIGRRRLRLSVDGIGAPRDFPVSWRAGNHLVHAPARVIFLGGKRQQEVSLNALNQRRFVIRTAAAHPQAPWVLVDWSRQSEPTESLTITLTLDADAAVADLPLQGETEVDIWTDLSPHPLVIPVRWNLTPAVEMHDP